MNHEAERSISERLDATDYSGALSAAMTIYGPEIFGYLKKWLRDETLAEDAYSAFSEAIVKGVRGFKRTCSFRVWAYVVAENEAKRVSATRARFTRLDTSEEGRLVAPSRHSGHTTDRAIVNGLRAELSEEDEKLLILRVDRALSWAEIAVILSTMDAPVTAIALRTRFHRLKKQLTEQFQRERDSNDESGPAQ